MNIEKMTELMASPAGQWIGALAIASAIILFALLVKTILLRKLTEMAKKTTTSIDDAAVKMIEATKLGLIVILALFAGCHNLDLPARLIKILDGGAAIALFLQLGLWLAAALEFWINRSRERAMANNVGAATSLSALSFLARVVLWIIILLLTLDNLGVNITALVAGLGIGGIAVALAMQNILGDLFASLSIVIDKPFVIGDFIIVDEYMGTVEHVGLKTTRLRSLGGEQIIYSNSELLKARVRNYKRMYERRVLFGFDLIYETPPDLLETIPGMVRKIIEAQNKVRFDRAHFHSFGDTALHFEVVYWVLSAEYNAYMDIQQAINLALMRALANTDTDFAYPTYLIRFAQPAPGQEAPDQSNNPAAPAKIK